MVRSKFFIQILTTLINYFSSIDSGILKFVNGLSKSPLDTLFILITDLGLPFLWIALACIEIFRNRKRAGAFIILALIFNIMFSTLLKYFFLRPRPDFTYHPAGIETSPSFPSGHTTVAFAGATSYAQIAGHNKKIITLLYLLACLVGFSRMYLGQHFPSDVFAGGIISYLLTLVLTLICGTMQYVPINQQSWIWKMQDKIVKKLRTIQLIKTQQTFILKLDLIIKKINQQSLINILPLIVIILGIVGGFIAFTLSYIISISTITNIVPIFIFDPETELITSQSIQQELSEYGIYIMIFALALSYVLAMIKKKDIENKPT